MSRRSDSLHLKDMADHARKALRIAQSLQTYERFVEEDFLHQPALIRELEVTGEASIHVSDEFREAHQDWPWKQLRDTRNQLIHGYAYVDLRVVWDTVQDDLPGLIEKLEQVLGREDAPPASPEPESSKKAPAHHLPSWRRTPRSKREGPDLDR